MRLTMDEIARMAGVSKATVSRVVNNIPDGVSTVTRDRIKRIITDLQYDNDATIEGRRGMRSHAVALILPDITNPFFAELAKEVTADARQRGYSVLLGNTEFSKEMEMEYIRAFIAKKVDGVILVSVGAECQKEHQMLGKYHVPCILLDRDVEGMERSALVVSDNVFAGFSCCELLIRNGSRDVAFISGSVDVSTSIERLEGYKQALKQYDIPFRQDMVRQGNYTMESGYQTVIELERTGLHYSAILAANDMMALGALKALKELDYRVPEQVQIVGFDNIVFAQYLDPPLTTVQQPTTEMGRHAAQLMIDAIEGKLRQKVVLRLQPKLLRRKTTR